LLLLLHWLLHFVQVRYPYSIGMYVITPDAVKSVCWPLNMGSWQVDAHFQSLNTAAAAAAAVARLFPLRCPTPTASACEPTIHTCSFHCLT
jgi:hypothetical protein